MQPFPPLEKLAVLQGDSIAQVWLDPYGVRLLLESRTQIYIEEGLEQTEPDGSLWAYNCQAHDGAALFLHRLLYKPIEMIERKDYRLTLAFKGGAKLAILGCDGQYESGHIQTPEGAFEVF